jgi:hypothetical protein
MKRVVVLAALLPALAGCDQLKERMGMPDPARLEAEGKAVGSACRHAGRGLEDCYRLNPEASKPAVFTGWKEMNEYMIKNNMQAVPPEVPLEEPAKPKKKKSHDAEAADAEADAGHGDKDAEKADAAKDAHADDKAGKADKPAKPAKDEHAAPEHKDAGH